MPIRVVGGFKKQDLKPVPLNTQTPKLGQMLTIPPYIPARISIQVKLEKMGKNHKIMVARMLVYVCP